MEKILYFTRTMNCLVPLFCILLGNAYSQGLTHVQINGPSTATTGTQTLFYVTFWNNGMQMSPPQGGSYLWEHPGTGAVVQKTENSLRAVYATAGTHRVYYEYSTSKHHYSDYLTIQVKQDPCAVTLPSTPDVSRMGAGPLTLIAAAAPTGLTYQWYAPDGTTLLSTSQRYTTPTISSTTTYYLSYLHTASGCLTTKVPVLAIISEPNYVKKYTPRVATAGESAARTGTALQSYKDFSYFDGLGRPAQQVSKQRSVSGWDIVTPVTYDVHGRQAKEHLPYARQYGASSGNYQKEATAHHSAYYTSHHADAYGYSEKHFEPSPLNRVQQQAAPGSAWKLGSGRETTYAERPNTAADAVRRWTLSSAGLPVTSAAYAAGTLWVKTVTDENRHLSVEYTDKQGRTVLKKVQSVPSPTPHHQGWLCTYYVYDDFGDLRVVIPPKAVEALRVNWALSTNSVMAAGQYFLYQYDERRRPVEKKVPGRGWEYLVYDKKDRLVAIQDALQHQQGQWHYTKYDVLDRPVMTGIISDARTRAALQTAVNAQPANDAKVAPATARTRTGGTIQSDSYDGYREYVATQRVTLKSGFSFKATSGQSFTGRIGTAASGATGAFPSDEGNILTLLYYDSHAYSRMGAYTRPAGYHVRTGRTTGLLTGKLVKNLETGEFYETVYYHDPHGREVQSLAAHHLGGTVRHSTKYNFENKPVETLTQFSGPASHTVTRTYAYNAAGDLAAVTHQINSGPAVTLASHNYNELGQLTGKSHPGAGAHNAYAYNIRGWTKRINSPSGTGPLFGMELFYESGAAGNISRMDWKGRDNLPRRYNYLYDPAGRITAAAYTVPAATAQNSRYSLSGITYDPNGNLTAMQRSNQRTASTYGRVDHLAYTYDTHGNRLLQVADSERSLTHTSKDFKERSSTNYAYDANGNLKSNGDKQIGNLLYNHLNLPQEVVFTGAVGKIKYAYDAEGNKLSQKVYTGSSLSSTTDYIGEFVFRNGQLDYLVHEEGRAADESGSFQYEYNIKDHLGNVRQVLRAPQTSAFTATMEMSAARQEELQFEQLPESRQGGIEHNVTPGGDRVAWLNAARGRSLGPARTQELRQGDSIHLTAHGKYRDMPRGRVHPGSFIATGARDRLVADLLEFGSAATRSAAPNAITVFNITDLLVRNLQKKDAPEAYLMYALYDADSNLYAQGKKVLTKKAANRHEVLDEKLYISKDGHMEAFLVNETQEDVWFDDFRVRTSSPFIVQETHYDPWGLELTGLGFQAGGVKVNSYLYNGKEMVDDLNLNLYDYGARFYDPAIGRWSVGDPLAEKYSSWTPYHFVHNNPIKLVDPDGRAAMPPDDHYINNHGSIRTVNTDDNFDRFYVQNNTSETGYSLAGQLNKNYAGLVQFPASGTGFSRYGSSDAGGTSTSPAETVGHGDHYLQPETAAAMYGLMNKLNKDFGFNISLGDMSSSNGSDPWQPGFKHHAGHGHLGKRRGLDADFRYLNTDGTSFQSSNAFKNGSFSSLNNQRIYDVAATFGFTKNYQGTSGNLTGVTKVGGHNDHGHLGLQYKSLDWKYVPIAPKKQSNSVSNGLNR